MRQAVHWLVPLAVGLPGGCLDAQRAPRAAVGGATGEGGVDNGGVGVLSEGGGEGESREEIAASQGTRKAARASGVGERMNRKPARRARWPGGDSPPLGNDLPAGP